MSLSGKYQKSAVGPSEKMAFCKEFVSKIANKLSGQAIFAALEPRKATWLLDYTGTYDSSEGLKILMRELIKQKLPVFIYTGRPDDAQDAGIAKEHIISKPVEKPELNYPGLIFIDDDEMNRTMHQMYGGVAFDPRDPELTKFLDYLADPDLNKTEIFKPLVELHQRSQPAPGVQGPVEPVL